MTTVISNGSTWNGQKPANIMNLFEVLKTATLSEMFFLKKKKVFENSHEFIVLTPICKENGIYKFFGNFEEVSHVFNIETTDKKLIQKLRDAIIKNAGWKKYISNLKVK